MRGFKLTMVCALLSCGALSSLSCGGDASGDASEPQALDGDTGEAPRGQDMDASGGEGLDIASEPEPEGEDAPLSQDSGTDGERLSDAAEGDSASESPELDGGSEAIQDTEGPPLANYDGPYGEFMIGLELDEATQALFATNAARFEEIVLNNIGHLKNPLWSIHQLGYWAIYFHIEEWSGPVSAQAIAELTEEYEEIMNAWLKDLQDYDPEAPSEAEVRVFGFVIQEGIEIAPSFWESYGDYPVVTGYTRTNEEAPWRVVERESGETFDQNWYQKTDFLDLRVEGNRDDLAESVTFSPESWEGYTHPEDVDMFYTKFWHRVSWDAVAQRQYLKIGGQITDYAAGTTNYAVFAHEMGHCFFLDDVYDPGKYPDGQTLESLMNQSELIEDFDRMTMRMVWKLQREASNE